VAAERCDAAWLMTDAGVSVSVSFFGDRIKDISPVNAITFLVEALLA